VVLRARGLYGVTFEMFPAVADWLRRLEERPAVAAEAQVVAAL
jgi:glutathione S-transferase